MTVEQESSTLLRAPARTPGYAPTLMHGDCLDLMETIESGSVDMILCDLPYGTTSCKWDTVIPFEPLWEQYKRLIKNNGAIVLFGSQPFTSALVMSNPKWFKYEWIWEKSRPTNQMLAKKQAMKYHENILVFYNTQPTYNPQMTIGSNNHATKSGVANQTYLNRISEYKENTSNIKFPRSIISIKSLNTVNNHHPVQKPVLLCEYLIRTYTNEGDTVLDNCMGSGTSGSACLNTGRNFIGIEKDQKYFEIARNRIMGHNASHNRRGAVSASELMRLL